MYSAIKDQLRSELEEIREAGLYKTERHIDSAQASHITAGQIGQAGSPVLNFCANNYLGLADHPDIIAAAKSAMDERGFGMASVRFICGTQDLHLQLEARVSKFLGTEDTILFSSCFDANGGVFESLFGPEDAIISDALNHASIIDGIRLCKAQRFRYANQDMADLEAKLIEAKDTRRKIIVTDGVFSMDGYLAPLEAICDLAEKHDALVMVDDSHAVGVLGAHGRGSPEHHGVTERIDIVTGTLGKALGGGGGGYTSGRREIVQLLRQRSRPYLFSNSITPAVAAGSLRSLELLSASTKLVDRLRSNTRLFRSLMAEAPLEVLPGEGPIVPVMIGEEQRLAPITVAAFEEGLHVVGFSYPVVPLGTARIRTQVSAAHSEEDLRFAADVFARVVGGRVS